MSGSHTVEVDSFGRYGKFAVTVPHPSTAVQLKEAIRKRLSLNPASVKLFGAFLGPLGRPTRVLLDDDVIPIGANVCFQRWNFDIEMEAKLICHDNTAIHLLYSEARFFLDQGRIEPNESQMQELEALSDPFFPTERQFLELVQTVPGYVAFAAPECKLLRDVDSNEVTIPSGTLVSCVVGLHSLAIQAERTKLEWPWQQVKRWKTTSPNLVKFEVCLKKQNAPIMEWVSLETPQAYFLSSTASGLCHHLKLKRDETLKPLPPVNPRLAGRPFDPLAEFLNVELFGATQFSSIMPKAR